MMADEVENKPSERKPDAVMTLAHMVAGPTNRDAALDLQTRFGSVLGGRLYTRDIGGGKWFSTTTLDPFLFPKGHPMAGQPRYDWEEQGSGVWYGYLRPEATQPTQNI